MIRSFGRGVVTCAWYVCGFLLYFLRGAAVGLVLVEALSLLFDGTLVIF